MSGSMTWDTRIEVGVDDHGAGLWLGYVNIGVSHVIDRQSARIFEEWFRKEPTMLEVLQAFARKLNP